MISPWSNAVSGRESTGCQAVSAGNSGSSSDGTRPRNALATLSRRHPVWIGEHRELLDMRDLTSSTFSVS